MTPAELAEAEADRTRARRVFVSWLVLATALTLAGNAAAAILPSLPPTGVRLAVHLMPPCIALVGLHALTALARAGAIHRARKGAAAALRGAGPVYGGAVAGVLGIAALAVVLSYAGLVEVALAAGLAPWAAPLWPLTVDLGIAVSTVALLVLRPISAADLRAARAAAAAPAAKAAAPAAPAAPAAAAPAAPDAAHHARAAAVVASGVTAKPVPDVAGVLQRLDGGASARRIHAETGIDARTVARIKRADTAAAAPAPTLTAV